MMGERIRFVRLCAALALPTSMALAQRATNAPPKLIVPFTPGTESADGVTVRFDAAASARAELVIGADGIKSVVRQHLLGADAPVFARSHYGCRCERSRQGAGTDFCRPGS